MMSFRLQNATFRSDSPFLVLMFALLVAVAVAAVYIDRASLSSVDYELRLVDQPPTMAYYATDIRSRIPFRRPARLRFRAFADSPIDIAIACNASLYDGAVMRTACHSTAPLFVNSTFLIIIVTEVDISFNSVVAVCSLNGTIDGLKWREFGLDDAFWPRKIFEPVVAIVLAVVLMGCLLFFMFGFSVTRPRHWHPQCLPVSLATAFALFKIEIISVFSPLFHGTIPFQFITLLNGLACSGLRCFVPALLMEVAGLMTRRSYYLYIILFAIIYALLLSVPAMLRYRVENGFETFHHRFVFVFHSIVMVFTLIPCIQLLVGQRGLPYWQRVLITSAIISWAAFWTATALAAAPFHNQITFICRDVIDAMLVIYFAGSAVIGKATDTVQRGYETRTAPPRRSRGRSEIIINTR
jgi:hypothetical protein